MSEPELLDLGDDRARRVPRSVRVALVGLVLLTVAGLAVVDHRVRAHEEQAVAACAEEVAAAVDLAGRRPHALYEYGRPALANQVRPALSRGLYGLIGHAARRAGTQLVPAARTCRAVDVLAVHGDLSDRRDRCLEVLAAQRSGLEELATARDSQALARWMLAPRAC